MQKKSSSLIQGLVLCLIMGLAVGCASTAKKPVGAHARAEKGAPEQPVTDNGGAIKERSVVGEQIPLESFPGFKESGMCQRIHFDYDKADIKPEWVDCLNKIAAFFANKPEYNLVIEGHCDERGTSEYNLTLGEKRAKAAANHVIGRGINAERIVTRSWGKERPLVQGHDENTWAQNRRAEFYAVKK